MKLPVYLCFYVSVSLIACQAGQATAELDAESAQGLSNQVSAPAPMSSRFSPAPEEHRHHWHLGNPLKHFFPHHQEHPASP
ncbi:MAG TPA: hypothetical protein PKC98_10170, partial [Candidatus Melainabacteria bacterium]|nr:hypothetical protein [Candidatus Melainabacteria bacterium]